jgi:hypothetical protein
VHVQILPDKVSATIDIRINTYGNAILKLRRIVQAT